MNTPKPSNGQRNRQLLGFTLIAIAISITWLCNRPTKPDSGIELPPPPPNVDSLRAKYDSAVKAHHFVDSTNMIALNRMKSDNAFLTSEVSRQKRTADGWRKKYLEARDAKDTAASLTACDSLSQSVEVYVANVTKQLIKADSIIEKQAEQIQAQSRLLSKSGSQVAIMDSTLRNLVSWNRKLSEQLVEMEHKQRRTKNWNKVLIVAAAIGGVLIAK